MEFSGNNRRAYPMDGLRISQVPGLKGNLTLKRHQAQTKKYSMCQVKFLLSCTSRVWLGRLLVYWFLVARLHLPIEQRGKENCLWKFISIPGCTVSRRLGWGVEDEGGASEVLVESGIQFCHANRDEHRNRESILHSHEFERWSIDEQARLTAIVPILATTEPCHALEVHDRGRKSNPPGHRSIDHAHH